MPSLINIVGKKFGKLAVIARSENIGGRAAYLCLCDCGNYTRTKSWLLTSGKTKSCGCWKVENGILQGSARKRHGKTNTPTYRTWRSMVARCTNELNSSFEIYGARGIEVCERWLKSFENFLEDMGERPDGASIDRINPNGNYEPENCRWSNPIDQANNRRNNFVISSDGKVRTLAEWSRETGIKADTIKARLAAKWPIEKALRTPVRRRDKLTHNRNAYV